MPEGFRALLQNPVCIDLILLISGQDYNLSKFRNTLKVQKYNSQFFILSLFIQSIYRILFILPCLAFLKTRFIYNLKTPHTCVILHYVKLSV